MPKSMQSTNDARKQRSTYWQSPIPTSFTVLIFMYIFIFTTSVGLAQARLN